MNVLIISAMFLIQITLASDNYNEWLSQLRQKSMYKSYDDAIIQLCKGVSLIGIGPTTMLLMQNMTKEKQQEILAISKAEKTSQTITTKNAKMIMSVFEKYQEYIEHYNQHVHCFTQSNNNSNS